MKTLASIKNGVVFDVEVTDDGTTLEARADGLARVATYENVQVGDTTDGTKFYRNGVEIVAPLRIWATLTFLSKISPEEEEDVRVNAPYFHTLLLAAHEINSDDPLTQYAVETVDEHDPATHEAGPVIGIDVVGGVVTVRRQAKIKDVKKLALEKLRKDAKTADTVPKLQKVVEDLIALLR